MKDDDCKECLNARLIITENGYKPICTLSARKAKYCLFNDKCYFEGSLLYKMIKGREE